MRRILIIGAGYSGLTLAHKLLTAGYEVTVMTGRTSVELRHGRPAPLAMTFPRVYRMERDDGLFFSSWGDVEEFPGGHLSARPHDQPWFEFGGYNRDGGSVAVDNRLKMADWLEYLEDRGGQVVIQGASLSEVDYFASRSPRFDLTVLAVGDGELGQLFDVSEERSGGAQPGVMTQATLFGVEPHSDGRSGYGFEGISAPDTGECYIVPQLTAHGTATCVLLMCRPGQALDCTARIPRHANGEQIWQVMRDRIYHHLPDVYERCEHTQLTDANAAFCRTSTPTVRQPVARMPSGGWVLGMADAVIHTDARSVQQVSNSALCAHTYFEAIREHGEAEFTPEWGRAAFDRFWESQGRHAATSSQAITGFWTGDHPEHLAELIPAVLRYDVLKDMWVTGWDQPATLDSWMWDPDRARATIDRIAHENLVP